MPPRNKCGPPVRDEDFVGREQDIARVWECLEDQHVLLSAPRRVGKTSLMHHLQREAPHLRGWTDAVYYSAEEDRDEAGFVAGLFAEVAKAPHCRFVAARHWHAGVRRAFARVAQVSVGTLTLELREAGHEDWSVLGAALADALGGLPPGGRVLVMVDELPVFLQRLIGADRARAERFLAWFRQLRQGRPERDDHVRWLLAGSIGLAPLAARERWSKLINDLHAVSLGALDPAGARALLDGLAASHGVPLPPEERDALLARLGWPLPYFLQLAFAKLRRVEPGPDRVERVVAALCAVDVAKDFAPWWERLVDELGAVGRSAAVAVLDTCAADPAGATRGHVQEAFGGFWADDERDDRRQALLECLEHDGYLEWVDPRWRFRSPLLREIWRARRAR